MNFVLRLSTTLLKGVYVLILPIFWFIARRTKRTLPTISDGTLKISASDLAAKIRKREVSSEQVCLAYIKRIREVNPFINAVVEERFESALQDARDVDVYLANSMECREELEKSRPLLGLPLTVKESCSLAGLSLCAGTLSRRGIKAERDSDVVLKLKKSGAIPLLVSNIPEISLSWECTNFITGRTKNPYDTSRTSGGSSGGEGALLGSGAALIGIGSDIAGSIRLPALFNGVFGHKPTPRIIPINGHYPCSSDKNYADYCVIGPLVRYAKDLKLMTKVMAETAVLPLLRLEEEVDLSRIKVFFMEKEGTSLFLPKVQSEIVWAIRRSIEYLKTKNCRIIEDVKFNEMKNSCEIGGCLLYGLTDVPNLLKAEKHNLAIELLKSIVGISNYTFNLLFFYSLQVLYNMFLSYEGYLKKNEDLKKLLVENLGDDSVFIYPTFTTSAFYHGCFMFYGSGTSYLAIFNTLGLPSTHIPCGFDKNGLPIGIQVVAGPHQDRLCFAVAEELEKCFGGWIPPN